MNPRNLAGWRPRTSEAQGGLHFKDIPIAVPIQVKPTASLAAPTMQGGGLAAACP